MKRPTLLFVAALAFATAFDAPSNAAHEGATRAFQFSDVPFSNGLTGSIRAIVRMSPRGSEADARYYGPDGEYLGAYAEHDGFASHHEVLVWRWALEHFADRE